MIGGDDNGEEGFKFMVFCDSEDIKNSFFYPIKTAILSKSINTYYKFIKSRRCSYKWENK